MDSTNDSARTRKRIATAIDDNAGAWSKASHELNCLVLRSPHLSEEERERKCELEVQQNFFEESTYKLDLLDDLTHEGHKLEDLELIMDIMAENPDLNRIPYLASALSAHKVQHRMKLGLSCTQASKFGEHKNVDKRIWDEATRRLDHHHGSEWILEATAKAILDKLAEDEPAETKQTLTDLATAVPSRFLEMRSSRN